jgi:uridylate kinase
MKIIFSIGGSILAPDGVDQDYAKKCAEFLKNLSHEHQVAVVVGGGRPARVDIKKARGEGKTWAQCDHIGILATRSNAHGLMDYLGSSCNEKIPESIKEAADLFGDNILVMGGTEPGHSTDAVACILGDWVGADLFVNASNIEYVFDKNPSKYDGAKPLSTIEINDLIKLLSGEGSNAGEYPLLDHVALQIIKRAKLKSLILDGRDIHNMKNAVEGTNFKGTTVIFD